MSSSVDWRAVATYFADRGNGCVLLDSAGRVHLLSATLAGLLGWAPEELEGRAWAEVVSAPDSASVTWRRIERALAGSLRTFECVTRTPSGRHFKLALDATLVGRGDDQGLLLTVRSIDAIDLPCSPLICCDVDYEVDACVSSFGRLVALRKRGETTRTEFAPGDRCYAVVGGAAEPCPDCPALAPSHQPWPRTIARRMQGDVNGYEVVTADVFDGRVRLERRFVREEAISAISESRVKHLADRAQLSERERSVLTYLLLGRSLAEIGDILGISPRTVKFHQANILEKLGADSRTDLIRLFT